MTKCPHCGHDDAADPFNLDYKLQEIASDWAQLPANRSPKVTIRDVSGFISAVNGLRKDLRKGEHDPDAAGAKVRTYERTFADGADRGAARARAADADDDAAAAHDTATESGEGIH